MGYDQRPVGHGAGIVKNRRKNGDFYWVEALVVPVRKDNQITATCRRARSRAGEQVAGPEALYKQANAGQASLPKPSGLERHIHSHKTQWPGNRFAGSPDSRRTY